MSVTPFIYLFKTPLNKYIYDFNTNAIIRTTETIFSDMEKYLKNGVLDYSNKNSEKEIDYLFENGFLQAKRWEVIEHPANFLLKDYLNSSLDMLTLQITQQCNLRCKYCPYSGSYYNRQHNNSCININIAEKAIDFYILHSYSLKTLNFGFYGGEPLIKFDIIKKLVEYILKKGYGKKIVFYVTTNATLFNEEIIDFLVENNFHLTISLDGPEEIHDKNREHIDGTGSFRTVMNNVELLRKMHPEFMDNVSFNCVLDQNGNFGCLNDFFTNYDLIKDIGTIFNNIAQEGLKEKKNDLDEDYAVAYQYEVFKLLLSKVGCLSEKFVSDIIKTYYEHICLVLGDRSTCCCGNIGHPGGPCIPGSNKLFVDIYGKFYPCEKLNESSEDLIIGNVDDGFNIEKVRKILNVGKLTEEDCKNCWCSKFCYQCILFAEDENGISAFARRGHCNSVRREIDNLLKDYCLLKEMGDNENAIIYYM